MTVYIGLTSYNFSNFKGSNLVRERERKLRMSRESRGMRSFLFTNGVISRARVPLGGLRFMLVKREVRFLELCLVPV